MGDPITIGLMVASTAIAAGGQIKAGNVANARAKEAAAQRDLETQRSIAQLKRESQERQSRNRAAFAASGGSSQGRSALALTAENLRRDADNLLATRVTGSSQTRAFLLQGKEAKVSAYTGAASTILSGGRSLLKGGGSSGGGSSGGSSSGGGYTPY
jgi:hypothetical protein